MLHVRNAQRQRKDITAPNPEPGNFDVYGKKLRTLVPSGVNDSSVKITQELQMARGGRNEVVSVTRWGSEKEL
jgi:hypothetical protein